MVLAPASSCLRLLCPREYRCTRGPTGEKHVRSTLRWELLFLPYRIWLPVLRYCCTLSIGVLRVAMPGVGAAKTKRRGRYNVDDVKPLPSVGETVETCAWLSEQLTRDLQHDLEADDEDGEALRNADIDLSSLRIETNRELLHSKITEALAFWEKLAERIPLRRHRPAGVTGRLAGAEDIFVDFDIDEKYVPLEPPAGATEVLLYQYYVQRLMCTVPRAYALEERTAEGPFPLRSARVKTHLDAYRTKKPFGDRYLLNEHNYTHEAGGSGGRTGAPAAATTGGRVFQSFSGPSRAVVTFALYRSAAKGKGLRLQGHLPEKRLFEVEALEHNTLQQIMEAMPPCLADRIMEENRRVRCDKDGAEEVSPQGFPSQKCMSLGGGFLFIRGVFYVTRPVEGEDVSEVLPPPPEVRPLHRRELERRMRAAEREATKERRAREASQRAQEKASKKAARSAAQLNPSTGSRASSSDSANPPESSSIEADPLTPAPPAPPPPDPWIRRWLQVGTDRWVTQKEELLELAKTGRREQDEGGGEEAGRGAEATVRSGGATARAGAAGAGAAAAGAAAGEVATERFAARGRAGCETAPRGRGAPGRGRGAGQRGGRGKGRGEGSNREEEEEKEDEGGSRGARVSAVVGGAAVAAAAGAGDGAAAAASKAPRKRKRGKDGNDDTIIPAQATSRAKKGGGKGRSPSKAGTAGVGGRAGGEEVRGGPGMGAAAVQRPRGSGAPDQEKAGRRPRKPHQKKADVEKMSRSVWGLTTRKKLGLGADGGEVLWADDATVADLSPSLGERYVFLHHRDCDHLLVVSDIRMEPIPVSPNPPLPAAAVDIVNSAAANAAVGPAMQQAQAAGERSTVGGGQQQQQQQNRQDDNDDSEDEDEDNDGDALMAGKKQQQAEPSTVTGTREASTAVAAAATTILGDVSGGVSASSGVATPNAVGVDGVSTERRRAGEASARGGGEGKETGEGYPRLSFRTKPNSRRCGICLTKTAVKMVVGHPLSDKAPLMCCGECFEMLYLDGEQKPLEGEMAGEVPSAYPPGGGSSSPSLSKERNTAEHALGVTGQLDGGPRGWQVFNCHDEH